MQSEEQRGVVGGVEVQMQSEEQRGVVGGVVEGVVEGAVGIVIGSNLTTSTVTTWENDRRILKIFLEASRQGLCETLPVRPSKRTQIHADVQIDRFISIYIYIHRYIYIYIYIYRYTYIQIQIYIYRQIRRHRQTNKCMNREIKRWKNKLMNG